MNMAQIVDSVYAGTVMKTASDRLGSGDPDDALLRQIVACGRRITASLESEQTSLLAHLHAAGLEVTADPIPAGAQVHTLTLRVTDVEEAQAVAAELEPLGLQPWERWRCGARRSFERTADRLTISRTAEHTLVVRVAWAKASSRSTVERVLRPTHGDWEMIELPTALWWAYPAVRLTRLAFERVGLRRRHPNLGPFLATPDALLAPLLATVGVGPSDRVVDLGCGDGRLVVAASTLHNCRSLGVEADPDLVRRARERVRQAGLDDRVTILEGDARTVDLSEASVVFAFFRGDAFEDLLPGLLSALPRGARILNHEQTRLRSTTRPRPDYSQVVVAETALTVAHRWDT